MKRVYAFVLPLLALATAAHGADSGFLSDYGKLTAAGPDVGADKIYMADGVADRAAQYQGVYVPQPEIFIADDSDYKGMSPDDMKTIADAMHAAIVKELHGNFLVLAAPKQGSVTLRTALSNVNLKKKKRGLLSYTPIGLVAHGVEGAVEGIMAKVDLKAAKIEMELDDSATGEALAMAVIDSKLASEKVSWDEAEAFFTLIGKRVSCRMDNARVPAASRSDCMAITLGAADAQ